MPTAVLCERALGRFGEIRVCDDADTRSLWVDALCQGSNFLEDGEPGPIPESSYVLAWLAAAADLGEPRIVMVGLGAGSGAVLLAAHGYRCTVLECDPVVIDVARRRFPLLERYERSGRIDLISATAPEGMDRPCDLLLLDAFSDSARARYDDDFLTAIPDGVARIVINLIDGADRRDALALRERLRQRGWPVPQSLVTFHAEDDVVTPTGNALLIAGCPLDPSWRTLPPFLDRDDRRAEDTRTSWAAIQEIAFP